MGRELLLALRNYFSTLRDEDVVKEVRELDSNEHLIQLVERKLEGHFYTNEAEKLVVHEYFQDFYKWLEEEGFLKKYQGVLPFETMKHIIAWELVSAWRISREEKEE